MHNIHGPSCEGWGLPLKRFMIPKHVPHLEQEKLTIIYCQNSLFYVFIFHCSSFSPSPSLMSHSSSLMSLTLLPLNLPYPPSLVSLCLSSPSPSPISPSLPPSLVSISLPYVSYYYRAKFMIHLDSLHSVWKYFYSLFK